MVWFNGTWPVALWVNNLGVNGSSEVAQSSAKHGTSEGPSFHEAIRCGTGIYCQLYEDGSEVGHLYQKYEDVPGRSAGIVFLVLFPACLVKELPRIAKRKHPPILR